MPTKTASSVAAVAVACSMVTEFAHHEGPLHGGVSVRATTEFTESPHVHGDVSIAESAVNDSPVQMPRFALDDDSSYIVDLLGRVARQAYAASVRRVPQPFFAD